MSETHEGNPGGEVETVRRRPVDLSRAVTDLDELWRLAALVSQSYIVPKALQGKPANTLVVFMYGNELGLTPAQALRLIYVPSSGMPQLTGKLLLIKLRQAGHSYDWKYTDDGDACTFTLTRADEPGRAYTGTFSVEDAITAGLARRDKEGKVVALSASGSPMPWMQYRKDMLFWRAVASCVNKAAPEATFGMDIQGASALDGEGGGGPVDLTPAVTPAQPAAKPDADAVRAELADLDAKTRQAEPKRQGRRKPQTVQGQTPAERLRLALQAVKIDPGSLSVLDLISAWHHSRVDSLAHLTDDEAGQLTDVIHRAAQAEEPQIILAEWSEGWEREWEDENPETWAAWQQARQRRQP